MSLIDRLADRRRRLAAAGAVAVVSVLAAAVMHAAAGGGTPSIVAISLALVISLAIGMFVVGPRITRRRAAAGVLLDQAVFHGLFAFFGPGSIGSATAIGGHVGHGMPTPGLAETAVITPTALLPLAAMVLGHLAAAVLAFGLLRRGAAALDAIASALRTTLARLLDTVSPPATLASPLRLIATGVCQLVTANAVLQLPDRRGPPVLTAV